MEVVLAVAAVLSIVLLGDELWMLQIKLMKFYENTYIEMIVCVDR
jgi:hypothetical protein